MFLLLGWMRQQEDLQLGIPRETAVRFPRRLQELCGYSIYKGQFGHIDNRDPIELLGQTGRQPCGSPPISLWLAEGPCLIGR